MAKPLARDTLGGLRRRGRGKACPRARAFGGSQKESCEGNRIGCRAVEGDGPVPVGAVPADGFSQVARDSWNPA